MILICVIIVISATTVHARETSPIRVHIKGIAGKELENVRIALAIPEGLVSNGKVNDRWMEHFKEQIPGKVKEALQPFGYYSPEVTVRSGVMATASGAADDWAYDLYVVIEQGEPVRVADISVGLRGTGSNEPKLKGLAETFPIAKGDRLDQEIYENAKKNLQAAAVGLGYLDADFTEHEILVDIDELSAAVRLVFQTGERYYFGDIVFSGAPNYPPSFLGRFIGFRPGDVFSQQKIGESQKNLANSDRFRSVMMEADKENAAGHVVPIEVRLEESKPKRLRMGVGYETDTGPKGTFKYEDVNFRKTGHRFEAQFDLSVPVAAAGARYIMPHPKDTRSFSVLSFTAKREDYRDAPEYLGNGIPDYFNETLLAEYERARSYGKAGTGSVFLQLLRERSDAGEDHTNSFSVLPGIRLSAIDYDNMVRPRRGHRYLAEIKGTHQDMGSTTGFVQFIGDGGLIIPLPSGFSLLTRAKVGATMQNEKDTEMPIALRFFAGGDKSVRGYKYRALGPTDAQGNVIGGKNMLAGSLEIEKAIGENWGLAAFYDLGNAFNDWGNFGLAQGAGIGCRYYSPVGPIRLDIARQINQPRPDTRIHFSIGFGL